MNLTKQKLEQLILQEMKRYVQVSGEPGMKTNPEYQDKILNVYKSDPEQGLLLADTVDEPLYVPIDDEEDFEEFLPFGIRQFEQVSPVTIAPRNLGTLLDPGIVEIFFDTDYKKWVVAYYRGPNAGGGYLYDGKHSKEYSNTEDAIRHYNSLADNKFVRSKPLRKNTDYTWHPDNPYTKKRNKNI